MTYKSINCIADSLIPYLSRDYDKRKEGFLFYELEIEFQLKKIIDQILITKSILKIGE